jgi:hypothetical protein
MITNIAWIDIRGNDMPLETFILVAHKYGIEYINFNMAAWRYCYSGDKVKSETLKLITHWCKPVNPNEL